MTNIAMVKPWPIEIDGLPFLKMVMFHGELLNNQMVEPRVDDLRNMLHEQ